MFDIYAAVTSRILDQLAAGVIPWRKPWAGCSNGAVSHTRLRPYSLVNQLLLGEPGEYLTLNQCNAEGGRVRKGSKSRFVVFWKLFNRAERAEDGSPVVDADGEPCTRTVPVLRYYRVFSVSDCEGITPKLRPEADLPHIDPIQRAEDVFDTYKARERVGFSNRLQNHAYYAPAADEIVLPLLNQFSDATEYYSTLFHEATHSTGHPTRLARFAPDGSDTFGSDPYAKEELVAEIGSAAILHALGMETPATFTNSAAYIDNWSQKLRDDPRLFISATTRAEKAVRMILGPSADALYGADAVEQ